MDEPWKVRGAVSWGWRRTLAGKWEIYWRRWERGVARDVVVGVFAPYGHFRAPPGLERLSFDDVRLVPDERTLALYPSLEGKKPAKGRTTMDRVRKVYDGERYDG